MSSQKQQEFAQMYRNGQGIKRIAHGTGFSYSGVRKHLLKAGVKLREPMQRKVSPSVAKKFQELYKAGLTMRKIGVEFGVSMSTVQRWLQKLDVQTCGRGRLKQISTSANKLTVKKAYVLGVVGPGDGFLEYRTNVGVYRIKLDVTDREFAEYFLYCLEKIYGLSPKLDEAEPRGKLEKKRKFIVTLQAKMACRDLLSYGVSFREKDWQVPEAIKNADEALKAAYLRGIADSQGSVCGRSIVIASKNEAGVKELCKLAEDLGIRDYYTHEKGFVIYARRSLEVFARKINFTILRKARKLENVLKGYKMWRTHPKDVDKLVPKMKHLRQNGLSYEKIAKQLGISALTVQHRLKGIHRYRNFT